MHTLTDKCKIQLPIYIDRESAFRLVTSFVATTATTTAIAISTAIAIAITMRSGRSQFIYL